MCACPSVHVQRKKTRLLIPRVSLNWIPPPHTHTHTQNTHTHTNTLPHTPGCRTRDSLAPPRVDAAVPLQTRMHTCAHTYTHTNTNTKIHAHALPLPHTPGRRTRDSRTPARGDTAVPLQTRGRARGHNLPIADTGSVRRRLSRYGSPFLSFSCALGTYFWKYVIVWVWVWVWVCASLCLAAALEATTCRLPTQGVSTGDFLGMALMFPIFPL